jgi:hypothetical protein
MTDRNRRSPLDALIAQWRQDAIDLRKRGLYSSSGRADQSEICASHLEACLRDGAPDETPLQVIHMIAVEAMTAQSDPNAEALVYRKALIGICNMALKAQDAPAAVRDGAAPATEPTK